MSRYIIAYDLGTGGNKAALYDEQGVALAEHFAAYETLYPRAGWHEQRPTDWWNAVVRSTEGLLSVAGVNPKDIAAIGISGHSLGVVPIDAKGRLLREATPIWSDSRPDAQPPRFFRHLDESEWYRITGNGFPAPLYSIFKAMWYRDNEPDMFADVAKIIGTKDYINLRLTGRAVTDFSYASGSGVYDLAAWDYSDRLIAAGGIDRGLLPDIVPSTQVIGTLTAEAAAELKLPRDVRVVAGGVDNSCMALGARSFAQGRMYNSLGSSSWIAVCSSKPLLDDKARPYVFAHVVPGMFTSAVAIFSAGTSFRWVRDQLCRDLAEKARPGGDDLYELMTAEAATSPAGAKGLLFNPSLAGGSSLDASPNVRGAFIGLDLGHTRADLIRSSMEGVAMGLRLALDELRKLTVLGSEVTVVGGGSRSELWRQILADAYGRDIVKTNIDQQAAALGAAALAAVGTGIWKDFSRIDEIHKVIARAKPDIANVQVYDRLLPVFAQASLYQSRLGDMLAELRRV